MSVSCIKLFSTVDYFLKGFIVFFMQIIINTIAGTFLVPSHKESDLIHWLESNAVKTGQQPVQEQGGSQNYTGRQLISEGTFKREF
jgi:hypothetical protein